MRLVNGTLTLVDPYYQTKVRVPNAGDALPEPYTYS